jgi:hypothetical protein
MDPDSVIRRCLLNVRITRESGRIADIGGCLKSADFVAEVGDQRARQPKDFLEPIRSHSLHWKR